MRRVAVVLLICTLVGASASAGPWPDVPIINGDFEDSDVSLTGWHAVDMIVQNGGLGNPTNWARFDNPGDGKLWQRFLVPEGTTNMRLDFRFTGYLGDNPNNPDGVINATVKAMAHASDELGTDIWDMYKLMWSTDEASGGWIDVTTYWALPNPVVTPAGGTDNARIMFQWDRGGDRLYNTGIDDVVVSAIPAPGAALLAFLGLTVAGERLRRKRA